MSTKHAGAEINVTPLIDVLLVLLIIFLVMLPVMMKMETVNIPPKNPDGSEDVPVVVKVEADLSMSIDDGAVFTAVDLAAQLRPKLVTTKVVFLDVVDAVPWSDVVGTVDTVRSLGSEGTLQIAVRVREE